jgi:hypothetical protein
MKDLDQYYDLRELVKDFGGVENFRFFGKLDKYDMITPFGFVFTSSSDNWVECKIEDDNSFGELYTLKHGYKVNIVPDHDNEYVGRKFYQSDLLSMLKSGTFILKTSEGTHIEQRECYEHLCGNVYIHHQWFEVV